MKWIGYSELKDKSVVERFEAENEISFPIDYKKIIHQFNAGSPSADAVRISDNQVTDVKLMLSFNEGDEETIFSVYPFFSKKSLIPFATDSAGNYFCFSGDEVVFWEHEEDDIIKIADNFQAFIKMLH